MSGMSSISIIVELGDEEHALLEPPSRTYTSTAVQRAFLVWTVLGHVNQFRDVCDYFQRLEYLEESFTPEQRKESRDHEYSLLTKEPPKSPYLLENFPFLYPTNKVQYRYPDEMKRGCMSFNDQGWNKSADRDEASTVDIIRTSHLIRNYCIAQKINIRDFLAEFQNFARNHSVNPTESNLAIYIQHRNVQQERQLVARYQAFDTRFLNSPPNQSYTDLDPLPQNNQIPMNHQPNYDFVPENTHRRIPSNSQQYNQPKVGIPLAVQQAKRHFYSDAGVNKNVAANSQLIKSAVNMSECGIDDVLNNITNINNAYARKISTSNEMPIKIKNYLAEDENNTHRLVTTENKVFVTLPPNQLPYFYAHQTASPVNVWPHIFYYPYLLDLNTKDELPEEKSNLVFSMKNKNLPVPIIAPTKKPSYSKVKSKGSKSAAKKT